MRWFRPSLVRRLTLGFILSNAVTVLLFLLIFLYPFALAEEDEPVGPELPLILLQEDLGFTRGGSLTLAADAELHSFSRAHPGMWFVAQSGNSRVTGGPVPAAFATAVASQPRAPFSARYRDIGATGPAGHAVTQEIEVDGRKVLASAGGVVSTSVSFDQFTHYAWENEFYLIPLLTALFNLAGGLIAIPIVLRSVRSTARSAAELDPTDISKRLPETGVVKELRPIVAAFNAALDRLADGFEQRRRFIADVAHELRTPLAVLNMHVEALPQGGNKQDLQRTVYRLAQMVGQMLDAERLTLGERRRTHLNLVDVVKDAVAEVAPLAVTSGYEVSFQAASSEVIVWGDPHSIARAITNLLGNAVAHGGGSGMIDVKVGANGIVDVSDQGEGIPRDAWERIFEPFHRERWDRDGCGLGLHLVREIMQAHNGEAKVVSSGPGAVFRLSFPQAG